MEKRAKYYQELKIFPLIKANTWKYKDPGSQNFGKFNPINEDPRDYYGNSYQSIKVGISDDLRVILEQMKLPNDLKEEIRWSVHKREANDARERIFEGGYDLIKHNFPWCRKLGEDVVKSGIFNF